MVIVRDLGFAIFDSTAPHEYFPEKQSDEIIDVYQIAVQAGTDEAYADELKTIAKRYRQEMIKGTSYLAEAKKWKDELEQLDNKPIDEEALKEICQLIFENL
jgi:hypothetical protein